MAGREWILSGKGRRTSRRFGATLGGLPHEGGDEGRETEREERMEECLKAAAKVPMEVMERAVSVMDGIEFLALHGNQLAVN